MALVNFDQGQRIVRGFQLLQDYNDPNVYYYVPKFPRLATRDDGTLEFLCLKYVDATGTANGGLFHALIEFSLPPEIVADLEKELKKALPQARIAGPVPLMQTMENGEEGTGSFQVVSAVLVDKDKGGFTRSVITSGKAPLTPGSKAVVAAVLNQQGATLLWDSFGGATSDVSVAIHGYYEAAVQGYNAKVTADLSTVYKHFSRIANVQQEYTRRQLRDVVDNLQRDGTLKVEVLDRTSSLGIKASDMDGILQAVTSKLTELMFDSKTGWAADPSREAAVEPGQLPERQKRGWFSSVFGGAQDTKYFTDNQYVIKKREDIRHNVFSLNLAKNSTIKIPVDTAGNLGGLYSAIGRDTRYFRIVNLNDPAFEFRPVYFQIDGDYVDSFQDTINFVTVNFRKVYGGDRPTFTRSITFNYQEVKTGKTVQEISFPRLGMVGADWTDYEYQVRWSLRDAPTISLPAQPDQWIRSHDAAISLAPPFTKHVIEIEADRQLFRDRKMATAVVEFAALVGNKPKLQRRTSLRANDSDPLTKIAVYADRNTPIGIHISWYSPAGVQKERLKLLESDFVYITPPSTPSTGGTP
jgi:hypothetical protein